MNMISILCGVGVIVFGFITFCVTRGFKSLGNKKMAAFGTKLVIVYFVSVLFLIILGLLFD